MANRVNVGMLGMGVVGTGVAARLTGEEGQRVGSRLGCDVALKRVLVREAGRKRGVGLAEGTLTTNASDVVDDKDVEIVVEVLGGENPAREYISRALKNGKHVVTANKEVIAKHGPELLNLARDNGVELLFEASVGGGIPVLRPLKDDLVANNVTSVSGIVNGTTNYILTRMAEEGTEFQDALKQAQELGYAEPDPTNDIEGIDAAYKLTVLSMLAFGVAPRPLEIYREGITKLSTVDFDYARELGYAIKLLANGERKGNVVELRVHPTLVPRTHLLAHVNDVYNAVAIEGSNTGTLMMYGRGAGPDPTSSAVIADVANIVRRMGAAMPVSPGSGPASSGQLGKAVPAPACRVASPGFVADPSLSIAPDDQMVSRYYLRLPASDAGLVKKEVEGVLKAKRIDVTSSLAKPSDLVMITEPAAWGTMRAVLEGLTRAPGVRGPIGLIRILG